MASLLVTLRVCPAADRASRSSAGYLPQARSLPHSRPRLTGCAMSPHPQPTLGLLSTLRRALRLKRTGLRRPREERRKRGERKSGREDAVRGNREEEGRELLCYRMGTPPLPHRAGPEQLRIDPKTLPYRPCVTFDQVAKVAVLRPSADPVPPLFSTPMLSPTQCRCCLC